ncbi:MAG: RadC family protein [Clostridia bacterium]|jgi:DNA repair protein RadC
MKLKELPNSERPYEKMQMYGAKFLSNSELLAIIIKTGTQEETAVELAQKVLTMQNTKEEENLRFLQEISIEEFMQIKGIGKVKAIQLKAMCELAKRMARPIHDLNCTITFPEDIAKLMMEELRYEKREVVKVILLNTKNIVQKIIEVGVGSTSLAVIEPKDVLVDAVKMGIPKIILVHNHPSGDPTPSKADMELTQKMEKASQLLGIQLLDHIVIGDGKFTSIFLIRRIGQNERK